MGNLIWFLIIGLVAGWLAGQIMGSPPRRSLAIDLIVGMLGAILGGFLFSLLGLIAIGLIGELVTATIGAVLLIFLLRRFGR